MSDGGSAIIKVASTDAGWCAGKLKTDEHRSVELHGSLVVSTLALLTDCLDVAVVSH